MATTSFATGDALTVKRWAKELILEAMKSIYWKRFMGNGSNNIVQVKEQLTKEKGDQITFALGMKLTGAGVSGDNTLEGNEEAVTHHSDAVIVDQERNAIRLDGTMTEQRVAFNLRDEAKELLKMWLAEKIDQDIFNAVDGSCTRALYAGTATSTATLASTDHFTLNLVKKARTLSQKISPMIMPVDLGGDEIHVIIMAPDVEYDMVEDTAASTQINWELIQRQAQGRGDDNPIFKGALGRYHNVLLHSHVNVALATNWGFGANVNGANNLFCGRQAVCFAWAKKPFWREKEFDYANQTGFATGAVFGVTKAVFNSEDHAVIAVRTARTNVAEL